MDSEGSVTYFFDHNLSWRMAAILRLVGIETQWVKDYFGRDDVDDEEWIRVVAEKGWIAVSDDYKMRRKPAEVAALKKSGLIVLVLPKTFRDKYPWDQARWVLKNWERIDKEVRSLKPGDCAAVTDNGKLTKITF